MNSDQTEGMSEADKQAFQFMLSEMEKDQEKLRENTRIALERQRRLREMPLSERINAGP